MKHEHTDLGHHFRRTWVLANALGLGVGMALFAAVAEGIEQSGVLGSPELGDGVGHLIGLSLAGTIWGTMQWLVLRRHLQRTGSAILGTSTGLVVGYFLGYIIGGPPFDFIMAPALASLLGAIAQWLVLRRQVVRAGRWVLADTLGFTLGALAGTAIAVLGLGDALGGGYLAWIALNGIVYVVAGAVGGAATGEVLTRLLRGSASAPASAVLPAGRRSIG